MYRYVSCLMHENKECIRDGIDEIEIELVKGGLYDGPRGHDVEGEPGELFRPFQTGSELIRLTLNVTLGGVVQDEDKFVLEGDRYVWGNEPWHECNPFRRFVQGRERRWMSLGDALRMECLMNAMSSGYSSCR